MKNQTILFKPSVQKFITFLQCSVRWFQASGFQVSGFVCWYSRQRHECCRLDFSVETFMGLVTLKKINYLDICCSKVICGEVLTGCVIIVSIFCQRGEICAYSNQSLRRWLLELTVYLGNLFLLLSGKCFFLLFMCFD